MRSAPNPPGGRLQYRNTPQLPPGHVRWSGQALAQGRKKETITMTSERERGSDSRRTRGSEGDGDRQAVRSLEPRDTTAG